ncbi:transposable element Tcb1 transposase [Trichonephila clavipes]|nr:transposable element Tcb1 transposase [Trichonephila clavipes]
MALIQRAASSRTIAQQIQSVTHHSVSTRTIRRRLHQSGMSARHLLLRLPLTGNHRHLPRQWWDERRAWTTEWNDIVFTTNPASMCNITMVGLNTLDIERYVSEVEPVALPYIQRLPSAILQQDNARPHIARNVQEFFFTHQIESLPWPACSSDLSPIKNVWSMLAQRLNRDTPPATAPDQLWQYVEAAMTVVLQGYIQALYDSKAL